MDEDDYLRYRISELFNNSMQSLFAAYPKSVLHGEQASILQAMKENVRAYMQERDRQRATSKLTFMRVWL